MPAPKGHAPYPGSERGAPYGILGKPDESWTEQEAIQLGIDLISWYFLDRKNIWQNKYFTEEAKIDLSLVQDLEKRYPKFKKFTNRARQLQESRLVYMPLDKSKNGIDGYHARWMLARHHKGQWEEKPNIIKADEEEHLEKAMNLVNHLQSKSDLNKAESNINNEERS